MNTQENETIAPLDVRAVCETILGSVSWITDQEGFVTCPGQSLHTHRTGARDCKLYVGTVPTLKCFHASCSAVVEAKNTELRRALADPGRAKEAGKRRLTPEEKLRIAEVKRKEQVRLRAACSKDRILKDWAWPYASILADSPIKPVEDASSHWRPLLGLFNEGDVIWTGGLYDSGKPAHHVRFRTREQWLQECQAPGQFVCPAVFKPDSFVRGNDHIVARRFLVVESDELTKDQVGGVFRWLKDKVGVKLNAIVDTAGKSLHGWFTFPETSILEDLKLVLPQIGCDPKLFTASQPVRLPGELRDGKYQRLVWLNEGGAL